MTPQVGDQVEVTYLGLVTDQHIASVDVTTAHGELGVELDGDGNLAGIVVSTDGGATHIPKSAVLRITKEELS